MSRTVRITLRPLDAAFDVARDSPLADILFPYGVEFPCGGRARCKGCRVRVLAGELPVTPEQARMLSPEELGAGWRLACHCRAAGDLTLELAQWEASILSDDAPFPFTPRNGLGAAIDVGTTTIVAQLLDLRSGNVLAVASALNRQARHGADVMSRVGFAVNEKQQGVLTALIREQTGSMIGDLLHRADADASSLADVVLVGNTVMHHLFSGIDCTPLSRYPFVPLEDGLKSFRAEELGWKDAGAAVARFLPCLGGFVGSDILAGVLAVSLDRSERPACLIDLGTNGEIVVGSRDGLLCCSTAAGPAFEGGRISRGMRASTGAITEVRFAEGRFQARTLGDAPARGVCGSGLVDAAAAFLDAGRLLPSGRFAGGEPAIMLAELVSVTQTDIRELQLAKGAVAAGVRILLRMAGLAERDIARLHLAGAFGNYVNTASARRIGLVNFPVEKITSSGNTALRGAKRVLFDTPSAIDSLIPRVRHVALDREPDFQDVYAAEMGFPGVFMEES